jgi:hypothetical protein
MGGKNIGMVVVGVANWNELMIAVSVASPQARHATRYQDTH